MRILVTRPATAVVRPTCYLNGTCDDVNMKSLSFKFSLIGFLCVLVQIELFQK